jgi:hypothetical protein
MKPADQVRDCAYRTYVKPTRDAGQRSFAFDAVTPTRTLVFEPASSGLCRTRDG